MKRAALRELCRLIIIEATLSPTAGRREPGGSPSTDYVTFNDVRRILRPVPGNIHGLVWVPFRCAAAWPPGDDDDPTTLAATSRAWSTPSRFGPGTVPFTPVDAMDTLQHPFTVKWRGRATGYRTLVMRERDRRRVIDAMSDEIALHFTYNVDPSKGHVTAVTCVDSTSTTPEDLARAVAAGMDVPFVPPIARKVARPDELDVNWELARRRAPAGLSKKIDTLRRKLERGGRLTSSDVPGWLSDYFPRLYTAQRAAGPAEHYLVIDDNVQTGRAARHTAAALAAAGATRLSFAAGYYWPERR